MIGDGKIKKPDISLTVCMISFVLIVIGIINYRPSVFLFIPLLITTVVMLMQARVNRYAFVVGAINSILYAVAFVKMSLYANALYASLVSAPLQLITFANWSRYTEKKQTKLKKMSVRTRIYLFGGMIAFWLILYAVFAGLKSQYLLLDNSSAVLGIIGTILCALRFREYTYLQVTTNIIGLATYLAMLESEPARIIWVISSANATICTLLAWRNINRREKKI